MYYIVQGVTSIEDDRDILVDVRIYLQGNPIHTLLTSSTRDIVASSVRQVSLEEGIEEAVAQYDCNIEISFRSYNVNYKFHCVEPQLAQKTDKMFSELRLKDRYLAVP